MTHTADKTELKIAIVDDHPLTRFALRSLIEKREGWRVCCECDSPKNLMKCLSDTAPDVVVIDLCFVDESGLDLLVALKESYPDMLTLVYSGNSEMEYANRCFRLGASGYVSKEEPVRNVQDAIECVAKGYAYVSNRLTQSVINEAARSKPLAS